MCTWAVPNCHATHGKVNDTTTNTGQPKQRIPEKRHRKILQTTLRRMYTNLGSTLYEHGNARLLFGPSLRYTRKENEQKRT